MEDKPGTSARRILLGGIAMLAAGQSDAAAAQPAQRLSATLAPLQFLVGSWRQTSGRVRFVARSQGSFTIEPAVGGTALLRRDHNDFVMQAGHDPSYDQIMLIYPEQGRLRADWFDGVHAIHYTSVTIEPGRSVRFATQTRPGQPSYRLTYTLNSNGVEVRFEQARANTRAFQPIAVGTAARVE